VGAGVSPRRFESFLLRLCVSSAKAAALPLFTRLPTDSSKEDEVREWHCECGYRVVADDNEQLIEEALLHTYEVHPEMDLTEEQVRQMVAEQASDTEDASH
jgi:predicted small metal-binding protein